MQRFSWGRIALLALVAVFAVMPATALAKKSKTLEVCKHGCDYRTIQDAVDHSKKNGTIDIQPGTYKEGVDVIGSKYDGLTIQGTKKNAKKVVLQGKNAKDSQGQPANNGIEVEGADGVRVLNLTATNYLANGIHFVGPDSGKDAGPCKGYLAKNVIVAFNRAYGVFAFNCIGGRMTQSVGYGQGDSAYYVGATPPQANPKWTKLDHLDAYENVLGYSGTNSKYVKITDGNYYNNGVGIVPNTLDSEPYEPSANGIIENNNIFWNNFNYFLPNSRVKTVSGGLGTLGTLTINYPTGVGIVLLGSTGWVIQNNNIFGNFKWGAAAISDAIGNCEGPPVDGCPTGDDAMSVDNQFLNNQMGRSGTDTNAVDFFVDGSGRGNCFQGNVSSTFDPSATAINANLYPTCPAPPPPLSGTGQPAGDPSQFGDLAGYVLSTPADTQECSWTRHSHPAFEKFKPLDLTPGPTCP